MKVFSSCVKCSVLGSPEAPCLHHLPCYCFLLRVRWRPSCSLQIFKPCPKVRGGCHTTSTGAPGPISCSSSSNHEPLWIKMHTGAHPPRWLPKCITAPDRSHTYFACHVGHQQPSSLCWQGTRMHVAQEHLLHTYISWTPDFPLSAEPRSFLLPAPCTTFRSLVPACPALVTAHLSSRYIVLELLYNSVPTSRSHAIAVVYKTARLCSG